MKVVVSAPGKAILIGEHAAVYGRPALVAAVDRRLEAELRPIDGGRVRLELPEVGVAETVSWAAIRAYTREVRRRWQTYAEAPSAAAFGHLRGDDPAHLVKVALGEAEAFLCSESVPGGSAPGASTPSESMPGVAVRIRSEIPIGAGFGSSAAAAVALVQGCAALRSRELAGADLERLSLEVERRQHGTPSGIDSLTVIRGGLIWAVRDPAGCVSTERVTAGSSLLGCFRAFNSGTPAESTGAVVAAVRERRDADPEGFDLLLGRMEKATRDLRRQLEDPSAPASEAIEPIRAFQACLEEAGVVPTRLRAIVRQVEARGGAAKISSAGALSGRGAGSLLVYHPEPLRIDDWSFLAELERLDLRLGATGSHLL